MERFAAPEKLSVPSEDGKAAFKRADLEFHGISHRGDSYEGRIFLNAPAADLKTPPEAEAGYAGSFFIFGHGPCFGDEGHCEVSSGPIHPFDYRRPHPLHEQVIVVDVTEAAERVLAAGESEVEVSVVPTNAHHEEVGDVLEFERLTLVTYD